MSGNCQYFEYAKNKKRNNRNDEKGDHYDWIKL